MGYYFLKFGLKLGSRNTNYTEDILSFYQKEYFQYIELFATIDSFDKTINYWKQFSIPIIIHAPHSSAGMNLSLLQERDNNKRKLQETFQFADALKSEYIIFHSGVNGTAEEVIMQLRPFADTRCLIENKPIKGLDGGKCIGSTPNEISFIVNELEVGFCLDFGHAICVANTLKQTPLELVKEFLTFVPCMFHLTDGDYQSELDTHMHYGKGSFPLKELLKMLPNEAKVTNEAKHDSNTNLIDFKMDFLYIKDLLKPLNLE